MDLEFIERYIFDNAHCSDAGQAFPTTRPKRFDPWAELSGVCSIVIGNQTYIQITQIFSQSS